MGREVGLGNEISWPSCIFHRDLSYSQGAGGGGGGFGIAMDIQNIPMIGHIILGLHCCQTNIDKGVKIVNTK